MSAPARPAIIASVFYRDPMAALKWLEAAFGFELAELLVDSEGRLQHSEMRHGDGLFMVGGEWADWVRSPAGTGGANTQLLRVSLESDIDGHCARARAAGAVIEREPEDQFYGERNYMAVDPEGHHWVFGQAVREVSIAEMEAATNMKFVKTELVDG